MFTRRIVRFFPLLPSPSPRLNKSAHEHSQRRGRRSIEISFQAGITLKVIRKDSEGTNPRPAHPMGSHSGRPPRASQPERAPFDAPSPGEQLGLRTPGRRAGDPGAQGTALCAGQRERWAARKRQQSQTGLFSHPAASSLRTIFTPTRRVFLNRVLY